MSYEILNTYVLYKIFLVLQIFFHPECCLKKLPNDNQTIPGANIALLELKEAVTLSGFINIACIDGTKEPNKEATVIAAGWGSTEECIRDKNCNYSDILQTTEMQVVSREQCNKELVEAYPVLENSITEDYICAKDDDSGLCRGDIGGIKNHIQNYGRWAKKQMHISVPIIPQSCFTLPISR